MNISPSDTIAYIESEEFKKKCVKAEKATASKLKKALSA